MEYGLSGKVGCIQFYGLNIVYDPAEEYKGRIVSITLPDGKELEPDKRYTLCTNDFMYTGGDGFEFAGAEDVVMHNNLFVSDLMIKDIEKRKVLELPHADDLKEVSQGENEKAA